jgi:hypothetical protein
LPKSGKKFLCCNCANLPKMFTLFKNQLFLAVIAGLLLF